MIAEILAALKVLPELLKLLAGLGRYLKEQLGDNPGKFIVDAHETFQKLQAAKTPAEKQQAARAISDLIGRL